MGYALGGALGHVHICNLFQGTVGGQVWVSIGKKFDQSYFNEIYHIYVATGDSLTSDILAVTRLGL